MNNEYADLKMKAKRLCCTRVEWITLHLPTVMNYECSASPGRMAHYPLFIVHYQLSIPHYQLY